MGQDDALWHAFRAGGEQDRSRIIGRAPEERLLERSEPTQLVDEPDVGANVLEVDDPDLLLERADERLELRLVDKAAQRHNRRDLGSLAGSQDISPTRGEVDHRRDTGRRHCG